MHVFSFEICEIFKNTYFQEHLRATAPTVCFHDVFNTFQSIFPFLCHLKRQKTYGFLTFLGGTEIKNWPQMGQRENVRTSDDSSLCAYHRILLFEKKSFKVKK